MSDVTITYRGSTIATMDDTGSKTLETGGTYCEDDIGVSYVKPSGGGGTLEEKDVALYDYDGTLLYTYTTEEFLALTAMPATKSTSELTSDGWNWDLQHAQAYVRKYGMLSIGQTVHPTDGSTRIIVNVQAGDTVKLVGTGTLQSATVNWGDSTASESFSFNATHTFANAGRYAIRVFFGAGSSASVIPDTAQGLPLTEEINFAQLANNETTVNWGTGMPSIKRISFPPTMKKGNINASIVERAEAVILPMGVTIWWNVDSNFDAKAFSFPQTIEDTGALSVPTLQYVKMLTLPEGPTGLSYCKSARNALGIVIPDGYAFAFGTYQLRDAYKLRKIYLPSGITGMGNTVLNDCNFLEHITLPTSLSGTLQSTVLTNAYRLKELVIPSGVTTLGSNFATELNSCEYISIPASVTAISGTTLNALKSLREIHFAGTTPPTITSSAFANIPAYAKIYVPYSADHSVLAVYQTATNFANFASYMVEEAQA